MGNSTFPSLICIYANYDIRFGHSTRPYAPTYSSEVLSACILNLLITYKFVLFIFYLLNFLIYCYRAHAKWLLAISIFPSLKTPNSEEVQHLLRLFVDHLIHLYEDGIIVKMPQYPQGQPLMLSSLLIL